MQMSSFWGSFEEDVKTNEHEAGGKESTHTRQREERDQRLLTQAISTFTKSREEPEQDTGTESYRAIPSTELSGMKTLTEQREEPEQDIGSKSYATFSKPNSLP